MNFGNQSLEDSDPLIASILKQAQEAQQSSVCLLPEDSFTARHLQNVSPSSLGDYSYEEITDRIKTIVGFDYIDLRLDARHEALLSVAAVALNGNNQAEILYFNFTDFQSSQKVLSITDLLRSQFRNTNEITGTDIDLESITTKKREFNPKLIIVDVSMYQKRVDFSIFRNLADNFGAYLAIDIGFFAGLAIAKVYDPTLLTADFVISDSGGTLGGPGGTILFANKRFDSPLTLTIGKYIGEDYDMNLTRAKAIAIEQASTEDGKFVQLQSIDNARALLAALKNEGVNMLFEITDTHLVVSTLAEEFDPNNVVRELYEVGIRASFGTIKAFSTSKESNVLCFGTSVVTNQGMGLSEMKMLGEIIAKATSPLSLRDQTDLKNQLARLTMNFG